MPVEQISRYKKAVQLSFCNDATEKKFQQFQLKRGRSTAVFSLLTLAVINLTYAFLEYWILGLNSSIPLYSYLFISILSLGIVFFSAVSSNTSALKLRVLFPGILTLLVLCGGLYLQQHYRLYHAIEITLLVIWIGSLNVLSFKLSSIISLAVVAAFISTAYVIGASDTNILALMGLMAAVYCLTLYLSYFAERSRRMIFLTGNVLSEVYDRQENWAYTLIDLDMALSGILKFKDLTARLMEHIKTVIEYDSYILTSLDGKGPKPAADEIDGTLFEQEDKTLWSDDLLTRLSQTRQASVSAQFDIVKGLFGKEKKNFLHYRLDIPIFNDANLVGVVSLRRVSSAFDDLDMTASVSIATQAMMIYGRTTKAALMSAGMRQSAMKKPPAQKTDQRKDGKESSSPSTDMDLTLNQTVLDVPAQKAEAKVKTESRANASSRDVTVVPNVVVKKIQQETEKARKTITLLSRENAEHVSIDRYRTAAVEGEPLSLLLVEVDGLSSIREKEGDQTAYKVFAGIVKYVFSKTDKESDILGRYGQNGFSVLLPRVDMNAAEKFAENLRENTAEADFPTPFGIRKATLSIGVAAITDETGNHESMVRRADMALFVAKKNGRDCVKVRL